MRLTLSLLGICCALFLTSKVFATDTIITDNKTLTVPDDATVSGVNTGDQTITLTGDVTGSGTGSFAATIATNAVSDSELRQSGALSVVGRAANSTGNVADIAASTDGDVLRRSGTTLGFGTLPAASVTGLGTMATQNSGTVSITGGSVTGITDLAIADGGTGSSTVADAQSALGLPIYSYLNGFYVEYSDADTVTISPGQGYCNGKYFAQTSSANYNLTSLSSGADFHYIYVSNSSSFPTPTFSDSTTEPAYSGTLMGWYNGNDRCIGAVYNQGSSTIMFFVSSDGEVTKLAGILQAAQNMDPDGSWQTPGTAEVSTLVPINATSVYVDFIGNDIDNYTRVRVQAKELADAGDVRGALVLVDNGSTTMTPEVLGEIHLGPSRNLRILGDSNDDAAMGLYVRGWKINR